MASSSSSSSLSPPLPAYRVARDDPLCIKGNRSSDIRYRETGMYRIKMDPDLTSKNTFLLPTTMDRYLLEEEGESSFSTKMVEEGVFGWSNPKIQLLLLGTRDDRSPLAFLRNFETSLLRTIAQFLCNEWAKHIKLTIPAALVAGTRDGGLVMYTYGRARPNHRTRHPLSATTVRPKSTGFDNGYVAFSKCGEIVTFPEPTGRNVTMMPFVLGDKSSLPEELQCYFEPVIEQCPYMKDDIGKVAYLTVHEILLTENGPDGSALGSGLRIEYPNIMFNEKESSSLPSFRPGIEVPKSIVLFFGPDRYESGIYTACNRKHTLKFWDALIDKHNLHVLEDVVDRTSGKCEKLRGLLGEGTCANEGELIWMTDCTPHEIILPPSSLLWNKNKMEQQPSGYYYQHFRLVSPSILYWDATTSTPNPKVPLPDGVALVRGDIPRI